MELLMAEIKEWFLYICSTAIFLNSVGAYISDVNEISSWLASSYKNSSNFYQTI